MECYDTRTRRIVELEGLPFVGKEAFSFLSVRS